MRVRKMSPSKNSLGRLDRLHFPDIFLRGPFKAAERSIVAEFERVYLVGVLRKPEAV